MSEGLRWHENIDSQANGRLGSDLRVSETLNVVGGTAGADWGCDRMTNAKAATIALRSIAETRRNAFQTARSLNVEIELLSQYVEKSEGG